MSDMIVGIGANRIRNEIKAMHSRSKRISSERWTGTRRMRIAGESGEYRAALPDWR